MDARSPSTRPASLDASPALLAKGALRRLAAEKLEPTPENYARCYRQEAGDQQLPAALPPRALKLVESLAQRAFEVDPGGTGADLMQAMAAGHWDRAERLLEIAPAQAGDGLAALVERVTRGLERGSQSWTVAKRKVGLQRVLDANRRDARRLQERLLQLCATWETDGLGAPLAIAESGAHEAANDAAAASALNGAARAGGPPGAAQIPNPANAGAAAAAARAEPAPAWDRVTAVLAKALHQALPHLDGANRELSEHLGACVERLGAEGATTAAADALEAVCRDAERVLQHRHHLFDQLNKLALELTASLTDVAENDSWVRGQCEAMKAKVEEGLTARGARMVSDMLHHTRKRHAGLRIERERARDALKVLINRMLGELSELGSKTGNFHESVGRYAAVIEEADTLESLTGVVREMVEETRTVQSLVAQTQQRLQDEHSKATGLSQRVNELEASMKRLSDEVSTDQLTQIANRRGLMLAFEAERARMQRTGKPLAVSLLDIDNFKRLNDELGHSAGDEALKSLASLVTRELRPSDRVARYGGEEFVVLLPETEVADGKDVMTRLQRALTGGLFMHKDQQVFVTFSAGLTGYRLEERIEDALERADQALYEAKRNGKNRTVIG
jgi:diguanylate cyclase